MDQTAQTTTPDWLKLDNAAKIYPSSHSDVAPKVFRVGMQLDAPIRLSALQDALERTIARCPYYQVHLRRGFFWYYLQRHRSVPSIQLLSDEPITNVRMRSPDEHLFRVQAKDSTVAIDFSHVLTDGAGGMTFLATLIAEYLRQRGHAVPSGGLVLDTEEQPRRAEFEDAFRSLYRTESPPPEKLSAAFHVPGPNAEHYRTITGTMPVQSMLEQARGRKVSLTEYLVGIYLHSLMTIRDRIIEYRHGLRPPRDVIRIEVPVNLRRLHPSPTMRNFSLFVSPEIDLRLGSYSLEEAIQLAHHQIRLQADFRQLSKQLKRNVGGEMNPLVRVIPLFLKDWYLSSLNARLGDLLYSGVISNLGAVSLPVEMERHVEHVMFVLGQNPVRRTNCSALSHRGQLALTFGGMQTSRELEREFFSTIISHGVPVHIEE